MTVGAVLITAMRTAVGLLLLLSGAAKIRRRPHFVDDVAAYRLLPSRFVAGAALAVVAAEVGVGVLLAAGWFSTAAAAGAAALFTVFLAAVVTNLVRRRQIRCGCFGDSRRISVMTAVRLGALAAAAASVAVVAGLDLFDVPTIADVARVGGGSGIVGVGTSAAGLLIFGRWLFSVSDWLRIIGGNVRADAAAAGP